MQKLYLPNYCMMTLFWFFVFDSEGNPVPFLMQVKTDLKHSILIQVNHDIQSHALDKSLRTAPNILLTLLSTAFFHLSIIKRKQCWGL